METGEIIRTSPECEIITTRTFKAPRKLVYKAWTDPYHLKTSGDPRDLQIRLMFLILEPAVNGVSSCTGRTKATISTNADL